MQEIMLTGNEIISGLLNGDSLRTFMVPDPALSSNYPEHMESFDLLHIVISGDYFWAKTATAHLMHKTMTVESFCYTNTGNIFCSYHPDSNMVNFMNRKRYKKHSWQLIGNYNLVWDSASDSTLDNVRKEMEVCSRLKIAMLDAESVWNIHPVDLPMFYTDERSFELKTVMDMYPMFFRCTSDIKKVLTDQSSFFGEDVTDVSRGMPARVQAFSSFYNVRPDGTYFNFFDISRRTTQKYKRLKVFAERGRLNQ